MLKLKDLQEEGVELIGPSDPAFSTMVRGWSGANSSAVIEALGPYSVFVKNTSNRSIVACELKWELTAADGTTRTETRGFVVLWRLMQQGATGVGGPLIRPNANWFFTPSSIDIRQAANTSSTVGRIDAVPDENEVSMRTKYLGHVVSRLAQYTGITVSIDGVFFEDGTFVGPNSTKFFEDVQADIDARRDLYLEIGHHIGQGEHPSVALRRVEELAAGPDVRLKETSTSAEMYSQHKKEIANEMLQMRKKAGDEQVVIFMSEALRKPWIQLKKK